MSNQRTADQWWAWHDADAANWSPGDDADAATADAERRCEQWVAGESDDGPNTATVETVQETLNKLGHEVHGRRKLRVSVPADTDSEQEAADSEAQKIHAAVAPLGWRAYLTGGSRTVDGKRFEDIEITDLGNILPEAAEKL